MSIEATLYVRHSYLCPMQCLNHLITVPFRYLKRSALYCNFIQLPYLHTFIKMTLTALSQVSFSVPCINTDDVLYLQEWQDERLIWDPNEYNGLETLRMPCDKIWLPDIVLYNRYMLFSKSWLACLNNSLHIEIEIQRVLYCCYFSARMTTLPDICRVRQWSGTTETYSGRLPPSSGALARSILHSSRLTTKFVKWNLVPGPMMDSKWI